MQKLNQIEGIGLKYTSLLENAGIEDQQQLLEVCGQQQGRELIREQTGICEKLLLRWASQADLARIKGIGIEFAELLEQSGIKSVTALAEYEPDDLGERLKSTNDQIKLVKNIPGNSQLESWIEQAKTLPQAIFK